ncbi:hypothetical protein chiPu_0014129 [Chiloscyllium punctatum]|uniref:EF-hand domain-containing protein n=1 Tax=Chiloscyllium punctatum TaxID=137246 RepID=A0A401SZ07_CHIPU|nr:hypothetical protein [Chiloscyllium punctatum]
MAPEVRHRKGDGEPGEASPERRRSRAAIARGEGTESRLPVLLGLGLLLGVGLIVGSALWRYHLDCQLAQRQKDALKSLGSEGLFLFSSFDTNSDLYLSPEEFKPLAEKLTGIATAPDFESSEGPDSNSETLTIEAKFQPLLMETMTKSKDGFLGVSHGSLSGLRNWKSAEIPSSIFSSSQFKAFLPHKNKVELGETWWMIPSELTIFTGYLSNNRFYPPRPQGREVLIQKLLSMFHPRPFVKTRFAPQGAVACIRAVSDFYYDIVFRIHGEFQLNEPPDYPFWFTPGQFTGHIILSKDASHVRDFQMYVPNDRWSSTLWVRLLRTLSLMKMKSALKKLPTSWRPPCIHLRRFHIFLLLKCLTVRRWKINLCIPYYCGVRLMISLVEDRGGLCGRLFSRDLKRNQDNEGYAGLASLHLEHYNFPVEMMIALPNGTVIHHINANHFLDITSMKPEEVDKSLFTSSSHFEDLSATAYVTFLKEGLEIAKRFALS